jgi:hypothetical protein
MRNDMADDVGWMLMWILTQWEGSVPHHGSRRDDIDRRRGDTEEGKGRRQRQLG